MKGDFSKLNFNSDNHYSSVRMQQGRIQTDADWNEQADIFNYRLALETTDFIGGSGAPEYAPGFGIDALGKNLNISPGRYYINGLLYQNKQEELFTQQTFFPNATLPATAQEGELYLVYLDGWQRSITAAEQPTLPEIALNGADTSTRIQNIAQVKIMSKNLGQTSTLTCQHIFDTSTAIGYNNTNYWKAETARSTGGIAARVLEGTTVSNQLYRIEIHDGGNYSNATFKWSFDNGTLAASIDEISGNVISIKQTPQTLAINFKVGQWVELSNSEFDLKLQPGIFVRIAQINGNKITVSDWPTNYLIANSSEPDDTKTKIFQGGTLRQWETPPQTMVQNSNSYAIQSINRSNSYIRIQLRELPSFAKVGEFVQLTLQQSTQQNEYDYYGRIQAIDLTSLTIIINDIPDANISLFNTLIFIHSGSNNLSEKNFVSLDGSLSIQFETGHYATGDYWLIPTRSLTNNIEWPESFNDQPRISAVGWNSATDFPKANVFWSSTVLNNVPYAVTYQSSLLDVFNYVNNQWNFISNASPRINFSLVGLAGKLYVLGGQSPNDMSFITSVDVFDSSTHSWQTLNPIGESTDQQGLPPRINATAVTIDNKIYLLGGNDSDHTVNTIIEYNPATNTWKALNNLNHARELFSASVVDDKIYVLGGININDPVLSIEEFDVKQNQSNLKLAALTSACFQATATTANNLVYLIGGTSDGTTSLNQVKIYDVYRDLIYEGTPLPAGRDRSTSCVSNNVIYFIGGYENNEPTTSTYVYVPAILAQGIEHHYTKLAVIQYVNNYWQLVDDCRQIFSPLSSFKELNAVTAAPSAPNASIYIDNSGHVGIGTGERTPVSNVEVIGITTVDTLNVRQVISGNSIIDQPQIKDNAITNSKIANLSVDINKLTTELTKKLVPTGTIFAFSGNSAIPDGYYECNGQQLSSADEPDLWNVIQGAFGSNPIPNSNGVYFALPDLRGRAIFGAGQGEEQYFNFAAKGGSEKVQLNFFEMPQHNHFIKDYFFAENYEGGPNNLIGSHSTDYDNSLHNTANYTDNSGEGQPHENMPPYLVLRYIIKR